MSLKAKQIYRMIRSEAMQLGRKSFNEVELRESQSYKSISQLMGLSTEGYQIAGGKCEIKLDCGPDGFRIRDLYEQLTVTKSDGEPVGPGFVQRYLDPN